MKTIDLTHHPLYANVTSPIFLYLDGPDAAGKTTLATEFVKRYDADYIHLTYIKNDFEMWRADYMALWRAQQQLSRGRSVVLDRGLISENIYSRVYRGGSKLVSEMRMLDRVLMRLCAVQVLAVPEVDSAVKRHADQHAQREEMYEPSPQIEQIARAYHDAWFGVCNAVLNGHEPVDYVDCVAANGGYARRPDALRYNLDVYGSHMGVFLDEVSELSRTLRKTQFTDGLFANTPNYVGHLADARILFVGDQINPNKKGRWPLVDFRASSGVMAATLHEMGFNERYAVWCNANDDEGEALRRIYRTKESLCVVALGSKASKRCRAEKIPHVEVYHPSYANRFSKHTEFYDQIKRAIQPAQLIPHS